jgi:hypothetical protein
VLTQHQLDHLADSAIDAFNDLDSTMRGEAGIEVAKLTLADREHLRSRLEAVSRGSQRDIERTIRDTLQQAAEASLADDEVSYDAARVAGLVSPYAAAAESKALADILSTGIATAKSMANLVRTSAVESVYSDFIDALDSALLATVTPNGVGVEEATRKAIKRVAETTSRVTYAQADGTVIEQGLYGAVRRAVSTASSQTTARMTLSRADELGVTTFEVSAHLGARPEHAEWQGGVYSMDDLIAVCGYGDVAGLCGANCGHTFYPFIEGLMEPTDWSEMDDPTGEEYALSQRQRTCERAIRGYKSRANAYRAIASSDADPDTKAWAAEQKDKATALKKKWQREADATAAKRGSGGARRPSREVAR